MAVYALDVTAPADEEFAQEPAQDGERPRYPSSSARDRADGLLWNIPPSFTKQPGLLNGCVPGLPTFGWSTALAFRERLASSGGEDARCIRLQDLDWGHITLEILGPLIQRAGFDGPSTFIVPTLAETRAMCMTALGHIPESSSASAGFGSWLAD
eukprot:3624362-Heterocapsa_arctica.AAC.1